MQLAPMALVACQSSISKVALMPKSTLSNPNNQSDLMYRLLVQGVKDYAIYLLDESGIVLNWNAGAERAKGYTAAEIIGQNYECFYSPEDRAHGFPKRNLERTKRQGHFATEGWRYRKDGSAFWASVALDAIYDDGTFLGFAKVTRDLTEQRASAKRLEYQALHDTLTGLSNRAGMAERLEVELPQIVYGSHIALHYIDLDRFKPVNDCFGHSMGDEVLKQVAERLVATVGPKAQISRLGDDEFVVVEFSVAGAGRAVEMANNMIAAINAPFRINDKIINIGASIGIAMTPDDGVEIATLLRRAELALYEAKTSGRNVARAYSTSMEEKTLSRSVLETKIRLAVEAKAFDLFYQPIVDGKTQCRLGFEALLRWTDQTGCSISPELFIPFVEELGLMTDLGCWVLRTACEEAASWQNEDTIAVNISAIQLQDANFVELVSNILEETGLAPRRLELEITETAILSNREGARGLLQRLTEIGVGIALDDFGTGFSSLSLVRELPLTRIKIDRSFVKDIDGSARSVAVIQAVVALARGYDLAMTGEGVETEEQRNALIANGCRDLQGYLFGRPESADHWRRLEVSDPPALVGCA